MPEDFEEGDSTEVFMNQYSSEHDGILKKKEHKAQKTNSFFGE